MNRLTKALEILDGRTARLPGPYAYPLQDGGGQYGLDVALTESPTIDEARMGIDIPFADGNARDGVGDFLEVGGIDLSRHRRNPISLYDHGKEVTLPIGLAEDPDTREYTVRIDTQKRLGGAMTYFYQGKGLAGVDRDAESEHAKFCLQLYDLMVKRYVRGGSIGYTVIDADEIPEDRGRGIPAGLHLKSVRMLEHSAVVLPCNQNTVRVKDFASFQKAMTDATRRVLCMPRVCGYPLSGVLVKSLSALVPGVRKKSAVLGYEPGRKSAPPPKEPGEPYHKARMASTGNTSNYAPGDVVVAREHLQIIDRSGGGTGKTVHFADPGDRLTVVSVEAGGRIQAKRGDGKSGQFSSAQLRKVKSLGGISVRKSIEELRKKYRSTSSVRRRTKAGRPGSAIVHVGHKDVDSLKQEAGKRGVKYEWMGDADSHVKVRLSGDDAGIDDLAKRFGRPVKGAKIMKQQGKKSLDLADNLGGKPGPSDDAGGGAVEPYSAQVLRRLHEDHSALLNDYDSMIGPLEHEPTRKLLEKHLSDKAAFLDGLENHFSQHHKELPGLGGMGDALDDESDALDDVAPEKDDKNPFAKKDDGKDMDTLDDTAAGSPAEGKDEDEEPTEEEAFAASTKSLRLKYGGKAPWLKQGKSFKKKRRKHFRGLPITAVQISGKWAGASISPMGHIHADMSGPRFHTREEALEHAKKALGEEFDELDEGEGDDVSTGTATAEMDDDGGLKEHEKSFVGEASGYLKGLAEPDSPFEEEDRYKSYHYHKTLEGIGQMQDDAEDALDPDAVGKSVKTKASPEGVRPATRRDLNRDAGSRQERKPKRGGVNTPPPAAPGGMSAVGDIDAPVQTIRMNVAGNAPAGGKALHPHRKACSEASGFFKALSQERAFGDKHRADAEKHYKALDEAVGMGGPMEEPLEDEGAGGEFPGVVMEEDDAFEPGEMQEKAMRQEALKQAKQIEELTKTINMLTSAVSS